MTVSSPALAFPALPPAAFRVLGPVEVWRDDRPVRGLPPQHRAALAALLVDAGRVVPVDVLVDRVWDGASGGSPGGAVQVIVSKLRRTLEPETVDGAWELLVTRAPGYLLAVPPDAVDAGQFAELLHAGRGLAQRGEVEPARQAVTRALALWRGPAYADIAAAFAVEEAARLEEQRLAALELAAELDLVLGRHAELIESLPALVRAQPLREGLRASLVLALYRGGRQAEALQVYADTRALLADELGVDPGRDLQRLYERVLRQDPALDLPSAPGAAAGVPAPRSEDQPPVAPADTLPAALTSFVGRGPELAAAAAALAQHRLVTLVGPGGSGKTRLAVAAARAQLTGGRGVELVELAGVDDPSLVPEHLASTLNVNLTGGDATAPLVSALRGRHLLLLLDNCEHLLDAVAGLAATLLSRVPDLAVLATSREPLSLPGEAVLPVGPLPAAEPGSAAVRLFLDRARLASPELAEPTPDQLELSRRICAELDGLPLAIELAAACLTTLPLAEVAARVDDRFSLLAGGWRTAPPHQRTLAATVQWSVDLLTAQERAVFQAASVFADGFGPDGLDAVAGGPPGGTLGALRAVAAKSLIELDHGRGRYRMLETLRQYADQGLDDDTRRTYADRAAAFLADLVERIEPTLRRHGSAAGWKRLDAEQQNLRAALAHTLATGQPELALRIAGAVTWWWYRRGHVQEGRRWLRSALDAAGGDAPRPYRLRALLGDALLAYLAGDVAAVWERTQEIIPLGEQGEDDGTVALALVLRAFLRALLHQDVEAAVRDATRGFELADRCGVDWVQAEIAMTEGQFARVLGDRAGALAHLDRAGGIALRIGHDWAWLSTQWVRAKVLVDLGDGPGALRALSSAVSATSSELDATGALAGLLVSVGAATAAGDPRSGAVLLGAVGSQSLRVGYDPLQMDPVDGQAYVEATRAALDPDEFAAAVEEGRRLEMPDARRLLDALATRSPGARAAAGTPPAGAAPACPCCG